VVAAGGALGTVARYEIGITWPVAAGTFPWTTLIVNLLGSVVLGVLLTVVAADSASAHRTRAFAAVGFCGGFTTFSTWMVESVLLARDGDTGIGALYTVVSLLAGVAAVAAGVLGARAVLHRQMPRFDPQGED
jgi:CrcB protein